MTKEEILSIRNDCECLQTRSRARKLTQAYDEIMAPSGLRITQFSAVSVLLAGDLTINELSTAIDIDRTTLTRNLVSLERDGFVTIASGDDARKRVVSLTGRGTMAAQKAYELWKKAQAMYAQKPVGTLAH